MDSIGNGNCPNNTPFFFLCLINTSRLIAEKINKNERKGAADIIQCPQGAETPEFWKLIGGPPESMEVKVSYSNQTPW